MTGQDVIRILLPVQFHDREHKQVMLVPAAPTSTRTLLAKQLYYGSSKSDVPSVTFPCVQQQQLVMPAATGPRILSEKLYYGSTSCDSPSASCPIA